MLFTKTEIYINKVAKLRLRLKSKSIKIAEYNGKKFKSIKSNVF